MYDFDTADPYKGISFKGGKHSINKEFYTSGGAYLKWEYKPGNNITFDLGGIIKHYNAQQIISSFYQKNAPADPDNPPRIDLELFNDKSQSVQKFSVYLNYQNFHVIREPMSREIKTDSKLGKLVMTVAPGSPEGTLYLDDVFISVLGGRYDGGGNSKLPLFYPNPAKKLKAEKSKYPSPETITEQDRKDMAFISYKVKKSIEIENSVDKLTKQEMRRSASEKMEIIQIVERSEFGVKRTLEELDISRSTFYDWYKRYQEFGYDGLKQKSVTRNSFWNKISDQECKRVINTALEHTDLSPRELAHYITDNQKWFVSESSVYRILKERGLITSPVWILMAAADEFKDKTTYVNQQWQTDFTYFKIIGWGWYYLATVMDDYSRYIITWELCRGMESSDAKNVITKALREADIPSDSCPRLLSDNGSCYISKEFQTFLKEINMGHVRGAPYHPQTQGKIERYHRTMKNVVKLENYYFPDQLRASLQEFVDYYNNYRYHESLKNVAPADVYFGRQEKVLMKRESIKTKTLNERRKRNKKMAV